MHHNLHLGGTPAIPQLKDSFLEDLNGVPRSPRSVALLSLGESQHLVVWGAFATCDKYGTLV